MRVRFDRRAYLVAHPFEFVFALLAVFASISYFAYPETGNDSAIALALHPYDWIWMLGYGVAGTLVTVGLSLPKPRIEAAGLILLSSAVAINAVAITYLVGFHRITALLTYVAVVLGYLVRTRVILQTGGPRP